MNAAVDKAVSSRLTSLEVEDFKKIRFVKFDLKRGITELSGANGAGKSSVLDSIAVLLDGMIALKDDSIKTTEPIHNGAQRSRIRTRIGEMFVTRTIGKTKAGTYTSEIRFEAVGGKPYPATQKQLNDLIGEHNLDPVDFIRLDAKGKFDALKAFVPGFDFDGAQRAYQADYLRRTEVNRVARESRAAADLIIIPEGTPAEPIDEAALVAQLQAAGEHNTSLENRRARREDAKRQIEEHRTAAAGRLEAIEGVRPRRMQAHQVLADSKQAEITELQARISALRQSIDADAEAADTEIAADEATLRQSAETGTAAADALQARLSEAGELPEAIDAAALTAQIAAARATNAAVTRAAERTRHLATAGRYESESEQLSEAMAAREVAKQAAIASANLPIDGIEFGDGEIRYRGAPFDQASTAQKLEVAIARIVALNPKLRLCWIRDASLLDDDSYARLNELALKYDIDVLIETVRPIGKDAVVLENGHVRGAE
jgi:energy-coupling factor transporter ATP-binding protein EcfA2